LTVHTPGTTVDECINNTGNLAPGLSDKSHYCCRFVGGLTRGEMTQD